MASPWPESMTMFSPPQTTHEPRHRPGVLRIPLPLFTQLSGAQKGEGNENIYIVKYKVLKMRFSKIKNKVSRLAQGANAQYWHEDYDFLFAINV